MTAVMPMSKKSVNGHDGAAPTKRFGKAYGDRQLVEQCLAGKVNAWSKLYAQCHDSLLQGIRSFLGPAGHDKNLIEEIAARTWYALVKNDADLLSRFDPAYGCRLTTFLSLIAKGEARLLLRSEQRLKCREHVASRPEVEKHSHIGLNAVFDDEFLAKLSPAERGFCLNVLVANHGNETKRQYSQFNQWQLRHRVRTKLETYLS